MCTTCDCLCFVPRLEFDSAVQEMLPNTLLDMKRALYEVSCDWLTAAHNTPL